MELSAAFDDAEFVWYKSALFVCVCAENMQQEECASPQLVLMGRRSSSLEPTQELGRRLPWIWQFEVPL